MKPLTPIDVEFYEKQYRKLSDSIGKASNLLIPDAYQTEKEMLEKAKALVDKNINGFNEVLNQCSQGVLFNEAFIPSYTVENNINLTVVDMLWGCMDIISSIFIFKDDLSHYVLTHYPYDLGRNIGQFLELDKKCSVIVDDLDDCSNLILSVITTLDGYNI